MGNPLMEDLQPNPKQISGPSQNQHKPQQSARRHASPIFLILFGLGLLLWGISTSMFDIQATESTVTGVQVASFVPNWQMLGQIPEIISGQPLPANVAAAYYVGWIVEFASLIVVVCFDLALEAIWHAPGWLVEVFKYSIYGIALFNVVTNYVFEPLIAAWYIRAVVAGLIAVCSFTFPIIGVLLIEKGVKSWN